MFYRFWPVSFFFFVFFLFMRVTSTHHLQTYPSAQGCPSRFRPFQGRCACGRQTSSDCRASHCSADRSMESCVSEKDGCRTLLRSRCPPHTSCISAGSLLGVPSSYENAAHPAWGSRCSICDKKRSACLWCVGGGRSHNRKIAGTPRRTGRKTIVDIHLSDLVVFLWTR